MKKYNPQLCPNCKVGRDTFLLDNRSVFCSYIHCHNGESCKMYQPIEKENNDHKDTDKTI